MPETDTSIQDQGIPEIEMTIEAMEEIQAPVDDTLSVAGEAADAKAAGDAIKALYPVGTIYMTASSSAPDFGFGTWVEILMPITWADAKSGERNYEDLESGQSSGGTVHFWRRTA